MKIGDPASIAPDEDVPLFVETGGLGAFEHDPLVEDLHGVDALRVAQLDDAHLAEGAAADHLDDLEVVAGQAQVLHSRYTRFHCNSQFTSHLVNEQCISVFIRNYISVYLFFWILFH